jgi:hypothetical protein
VTIAFADQLALLCTAGGLIIGLLVTLVVGKPFLALRVALEFWTAAGLLRLAAPPSWGRLLGAAAIVAVRQLLGLGLRASSPRLPAPRWSALRAAVRPVWRDRP